MNTWPEIKALEWRHTVDVGPTLLLLITLLV